MTTRASTSVSVPPSPSPGPARWLGVVSHLDPKYGGLSAVVPELADRLDRRERLGVCLAAFCLPGEAYQPPQTELAGRPGLAVTYWPTSRKAWLLDRRLRERFRAAVSAADGLHIHGLWEQSSLVAARAARSLAKPYIVSAHGMLEPWALAQGRAKKQAYAALFERPNLNGAACLHALTRAEAQNYRDFGARPPVAVVPNGVDIPASLSPALFLETFPGLEQKRILLFLGRLHQKKGVELLVRAWAGVRPSRDAHLVIAGPAEDGTRTRVEQLVGELGLRDQVLFAGMLRPLIKWSALAAAECFVLPSYSEGLSIATLEAMGAGLPVIVTENCNLPEVAQQGAGWQVRAEEEALAAAIGAWIRQPASASRALGERGAALVRERYSWAAVATQMAELYHWVEGGMDTAAQPRSFVVERTETAGRRQDRPTDGREVSA